MASIIRNRNVWLALLLGVLGGVRVWAMASSGVAAFPHILAALTLLIPGVLFGVTLRRAWPAGIGLAAVVVIELSLS
ncbi:MAG: hypothetical protein RI514_08540 [Spiribacter sp.]|nr:hypothetical protein [Spiribacter sp.]